MIIANLVDETITLLGNMTKPGTEDISCISPLTEELYIDTLHERNR